MRSSFGSSGESDDVLESFEESKKTDLDDSEASDEMTSQTGSVSEEEGWFGGMGADFRTIACSLKDTAGGVASFVKSSALSVAAEIAAMEKDEQFVDDEATSVNAEPLCLPWEIKSDDGSYEEVSELKEKVLGLCLKESILVKPLSKEECTEDFRLDEPRIELIRRLLEIDENLAALHAKLSGRSDFNETALWGNYFRLCKEIRDEHMKKYGATVQIASQSSQNSLVPAESDNESSFVCVENSSAPSSLNSWACLSNHGQSDATS